MPPSGLYENRLGAGYRCSSCDGVATRSRLLDDRNKRVVSSTPRKRHALVGNARTTAADQPRKSPAVPSVAAMFRINATGALFDCPDCRRVFTTSSGITTDQPMHPARPPERKTQPVPNCSFVVKPRKRMNVVHNVSYDP
eukprot:scaffold129553_cov36-Tisochrysis_lutea.AAC.2